MSAGTGSAGPASDSYLLGNSTAEIEHLLNQAAVYAAEADSLLDAAGVPPLVTLAAGVTAGGGVSGDRGVSYPWPGRHIPG